MSLQKLTAELYQLFEQQDYAQCHKILPPIKIELIKHNLLVPLPSNTKTGHHLNDLKIAERILEIGALSSLLTNNYQSFESYFSQLKPFYTSESLHAEQPETNTDCTKIVALYLLYLLSQGLISKFHVELEAIFNSKQFSTDHDVYLQFPINLEKNLMEGNYIKTWKLLEQEQGLPCKEFCQFSDTLTTALRFEIAKSLEKTYDSIPISNCKSLLYFPQEEPNQSFEAFLREQLDADHWVFEGGKIYFHGAVHTRELASGSSTVIRNVLNYAEHIESIV